MKPLYTTSFFGASSGAPELTIVSAAYYAHWRCLYQLLLSAERKDLATRQRFIVYDLGLREKLGELQRRFPWAEFRRFAFERYPSHVATAIWTNAWKPLLIRQVIGEFGGLVLWLDNATLFRESDWTGFLSDLQRDGTYVLNGKTQSLGRCDPATLKALDVPLEHLDRQEIVSEVVGLDARRKAVRDLVQEWCEHALIAPRICPNDPPMHQRKSEQTVLSILLFKYEAAGLIGLNEGEIDIGSAAPISWITSHNEVSSDFPIWADAFSRLYYFVYKSVDQLWLRWKLWEKTRLDGFDRSRWEHYTVFVKRERDGLVASIGGSAYSYYADPFVWAKDGQTWLFVEEFQYRNCKGRLCCVALDGALRPGEPKEILQLKDHASFPFLFEHEGALYLLPETSVSRSLDLYVCEGLPDRWRLVRRLLFGVDAADTVLFMRDGLWWIITSLRDAPGQGRYLAIYYAHDLLSGTWQPHPINGQRLYEAEPNSSRRNAGNIILDGSTLLRIAQNNPRYYGEATVLMRIEVLTMKEFREVPYDGKHPFEVISQECSPHHISAHNDLIAWDVRDRVGYINRAPKRDAEGKLR